MGHSGLPAGAECLYLGVSPAQSVRSGNEVWGGCGIILSRRRSSYRASPNFLLASRCHLQLYNSRYCTE